MMVVGMNGAMNCSSLYRLATESMRSHRHLFTRMSVSFSTGVCSEIVMN